jgi:zinc transport system substrate-binding protein
MTSIQMPSRWIIALFALAAIGLGCDSRSSSGTSPTPPRRVAVLASVYPMAEMLQRIGGPQVDVQWLAESGQRPEEIEPDAELKQRANKAELVVTSGPWDAWAVVELSSEVRVARLVEPGSMAAARGADSKSYLWLNPAVVREMAEAARLRLTVADSAHDAAYRQNAQAYQAEVDAVDRELRDGLAPFAGKTVLSVRPVWGALCARYGLTLIAPVEKNEEALTAEDFKELARAAKKVGTTAVFIDVTTSIGVRQQIEAKTGLRAVTLDALGTSASDGRSTWARIMRYDLAQLQKGLQ